MFRAGVCQNRVRGELERIAAVQQPTTEDRTHALLLQGITNFARGPRWCNTTARRLGGRGDGTYLLCDTPALRAASCNVFSIGVGDDDRWDRALAERLPQCTVQRRPKVRGGYRLLR